MFPSVVSPQLLTPASQPRVLLLDDVLGFWVAVKVLFALFGRIMATFTALVACSPPFSFDPVAVFCSIFGGVWLFGFVLYLLFPVGLVFRL
ncbi:hypothetical protein FF1_015663 [Malus domestica]